MKMMFLFVSSMFIGAVAFCQLAKPVQWSFASTKKSDKVYEVAITASIAKGWHIYSQTTPDGGPLPTKIVFKANPLVVKTGEVKETGSLQTKYEQLFGVNVKYFSDKVVFSQLMKLKADIKTHSTGELKYIVCNETTCMPPTKIPFDIVLQ